MNWTDAQVQKDDSVKVPSNWLFLHYYEALTILFRVENALRMFVYVVLKDEYKGKWSTLSITTDESAQTTISAAAKKRMAQDATFGYLGYPISSPLMHLTSGELIRVILSDAYWPLFNKYFPASKEIVQTKLEEIGNVRNALAHFRPLKTDDVQVIRQNANQVLSRVEDVLRNLVSCNVVVPTNTTDDWYTELRVVAGANTKLQFKQSEDERWIQIDLRYSCPELAKPGLFNNYRNYRRLTILTPPLVNMSPTILDNALFACEYVPYLSIGGDSHPDFYKLVQFLFSRKCLAAVHQGVKAELEAVVARIASESDLIRDDNLARGDLVRAVWIAASRQDEESEWIVNTRNLTSPRSDTDPVEYWAEKPIFAADFLTNTESYPWMPVDVAKFTPLF